DLVPCGDLQCPATSLCVAGSICASASQVAACDGLADEMLCVSSEGNGTCRTGVCVIDRCGDGIVDPGEVCDDGNLMAGDGCRQDCRSDESCGNGLLDLGESCDCGSSDSSLALGCSVPNSDDLSATCDLACSRRCGDGV